ncbi:MAG: VanZ family protein [Candidatus Izemoplasmatales bacterium]
MRRHVLLAASLVLTAFIFAMSLQPGEVSGAMSSPLALALGRILETILPRIDIDPETLHALVRKGAHVAEYLALGIAYALTARAWRIPLWAVVIAGVAVAFCDESLQGFVPNRGPDPLDALCFDLPGFLLGALTTFTVAAGVVKRRSENNVS